ncbi:hypothetical protein BD779DRAFT_1470841 [Infundibulicybe gibba]|nr:hypothetical protein BD779DRAFT_1470841 [Infundibulicybe gibba]
MQTGSAAAIKIIWKCNIPKNVGVKTLCEKSLVAVAQKYGMDTVVIRKEPHNTTKIGGKYVKTVPHITGDILNTKLNTGYALHLNLDNTNTTILASNPPTKPNPEMWKLTYKDGKGFVLVEQDGKETPREV